MRPWLALFAAGCLSGPYDPPAVPAHTAIVHGYAHAPGYRTPFLCWEAGTDIQVECPIGAPDRADLSCDAAGCHGSDDTQPADVGRDLHGSDGPSCYECHGERWSVRVR